MSINLVRTAAVTSRLVGYHHGGWPRRDVTDGQSARNAESGAVDSHGLSGVSGAQNVQIGLAW